MYIYTLSGNYVLLVADVQSTATLLESDLLNFYPDLHFLQKGGSDRLTKKNDFFEYQKGVSEHDERFRGKKKK